MVDIIMSKTEYYFIIGLVSFIFLLIKKFKVELWFVIFYCIGVIYIVNVIDYTFYSIPLNVTGNMRYALTQENNFIPFNEIIDYIKRCIQFSRILNNKILFEHIVLNIVMGVPLGFIIPLIFKNKSLKSILIKGSIVWILIEVGQFIVNKIIQLNYRSVDVDDYIFNMIGTLIGFVLFKLGVLFLLRISKKSINFSKTKFISYLSEIN